jgi:hypothetical protein
MNVAIGAEAAQFPEKEYINGIAFAVWFWFLILLWCVCACVNPSHYRSIYVDLYGVINQLDTSNYRISKVSVKNAII